MQISLSRGYFTGSHFTFDTAVSSLYSSFKYFKLRLWALHPSLVFRYCQCRRVCLLPWTLLSKACGMTFHHYASLCQIFHHLHLCNEIDRCHDCHMLSYVVICCHVSFCFFFPGGFLSVFTVSMLTVMPWPCAAPRPTCGDDRSPRGRIPSCLAGPGEPGRASSSWARCRFHTEKFTNFTGRARDFSRLGATGLLFQHVPTGSSTFPLDPRWSPCTCSRARSMVWSWWHRGHPQRCPVKFPVWPGIFDYSDLFGLFYLFFYKSLCQKSFTIFASCGLLALKSTRLESLR